MTPRDSFGIVVRTVGLLALCASVYQLVSILMVVSTFGEGFFPFAILTKTGLASVLYTIVSLYLLRGAPHLMDFCYPMPPTTPARTEEKTAW